MQGLKHFHIAGCPRVTQKGIFTVLAHNAPGLESLGLEGLSSSFVSFRPIKIPDIYYKC